MVATRVAPSVGAYTVAVEGLDSLPDFDAVASQITKYAARAINATARRYRTQSSRAIREQVAFKARYLDAKGSGHLFVNQRATATRLEASITGRFRPTSLTHFVVGSKAPQRRGPRVRVSPSRTEKMNRAFIIALRSGNIGLAVRLRPGERLENKRVAIQMNNGLYLLYGPSVNQVFREVAGDVAPDAEDYLEQEFLRLMEVFT